MDEPDAHKPATGAHDPPGIWVFIAADCAGFAIFFLVFIIERYKQPALFDSSSRTLDATLGLVNTLILITSSWLVALAVKSKKMRCMAEARGMLIAGTVVAGLFGLIKMSEYYHKADNNITPLTNRFYTFYFVLTGIHFLHYIIGIVVLLWMNSLIDRSNTDKLFEAGGLYWHMVDLLWMFLYPMFYLLGAR